MVLSPEARRQFQDWGRDGGRERARRLSPATRKEIARLAALARWTKEEFGATRFVDLGLPGAELVDQGLRDVAMGVTSPESFLVAIAEPRLRREGISVPTVDVSDPELRLYRALEEEHGELAHARYNAMLRQMTSFADACHLVRRPRSSNAE